MVELQYFGHSFFRLKNNGESVIIDPIFDSSKTVMKKQQKIPVKPSDLSGISLILLTNETPEHFDRDAVEAIAKKNSSTVGAHESILQTLSLPRAQKLPLSSDSNVTTRGFQVKTEIAHYPKSFYPMGYVIGCDGVKVYHAGVTALLDTFAQVKADVALLPISSKSMDVVDAVRATKMIKPKTVIPMQHNIFENRKHDPTDFKKRIEDSVLKTNTILLNPGQKVKL